MAGKKPAKPIAGQNKTVIQDPKVYGLLVRFVGSKEAPCICSICKREVIRGIVRMKENLFFCSAACAKTDWSLSAASTTEQ